MIANWTTASELKLAPEAVLKLDLKIDVKSRLTRHIVQEIVQQLVQQIVQNTAQHKMSQVIVSTVSTAQLTYLPCVFSWLRRFVLSKRLESNRFGSEANTAYVPDFPLVNNVPGKSVASYIGKLPAIVAHDGRF